MLENQEKFTARETQDAAAARNFMGKLGMSNSLEAKRVINNMLNCRVTKRHIDIADIIYGPKSVEALSGSTSWKKSPIAAIHLGP